MAQIDYLPVATGNGANVDTQATFAGAGYQQNGFVAGKASSASANKIWRQSSMMAAALANVVSVALGGIAVLDDGNLQNLIQLLTLAFSAIAQGAQNTIVAVPFANAMAFNGAAGNRFETTMTGSNVSATFQNPVKGQLYTFMFKQDGTGGRIFTPPNNLPLPAIDGTPNATTLFLVYVDSNSTARVLAGPNVS